MTLTIGTDAYATLQEVRDFWAARGEASWATLPDGEAEVYIRLATDYVDRRWNFIGIKATKEQRLKWPRERAVVEGEMLPDNEIPWQVREATALVADLLRIGTFDALGILTTEGAAVTMEKVDVITVQYAAHLRLLSGDIPTHVIQTLRPLLATSQGGLVRA